MDRSARKFTVSFVLVDDAWNDPYVMLKLGEIGEAMIEEGFPRPLTIELCDEHYTAHTTVIVEEAATGS